MQVLPWKRILLTRSVALAPTLLVALLTRNPNNLDVLNQWFNILQSIQLPFAVVPVRNVIMTCQRDAAMTPAAGKHLFTAALKLSEAGAALPFLRMWRYPSSIVGASSNRGSMTLSGRHSSIF